MPIMQAEGLSEQSKSTERPSQTELVALAVAQITATAERFDTLPSRARRDVLTVLANAVADLHALGVTR